MKHWFVIYTKPREEFRAKENLENQGFEVFLPTCQIERVKNSKLSILTEPLFPRYLFIQLDEVSSNWFPIRSTKGVASLLKFGKESEPVHVPDQLILNLKNFLDNHSLIDRFFLENAPIQICDGAFKGLVGVLKKINESSTGEQRAMVLVELLGKFQTLSMSLKSIQKV
jgi:transcriptional antiterminator RfaH